MSVLLVLSGCAQNFINDTEPKKCQLHNTPLTTMIVPLEHGLPARPNDHYTKSKKELFPNSRLQVNGGCVIGLKEMIFPERAKVLACKACNHAEKEWLKHNDKYD